MPGDWSSRRDTARQKQDRLLVVGKIDDEVPVDWKRRHAGLGAGQRHKRVPGTLEIDVPISARPVCHPVSLTSDFRSHSRTGHAAQ